MQMTIPVEETIETNYLILRHMIETASVHLKNSRYKHINSIERNKMPGIKNSILDTVGNTPIVKINNIGPNGPSTIG